jgi:hypothetical protein
MVFVERTELLGLEGRPSVHLVDLGLVKATAPLLLSAGAEMEVRIRVEGEKKERVLSVPGGRSVADGLPIISGNWAARSCPSSLAGRS